MGIANAVFIFQPLVAMVMDWNAFWIILACSLAAVTCSLLGVFLMLRGASMMGDAIAHSVLPGIVVAYLLTGGRERWALFPAAVAAGMFTTFGVEWLKKSAGLRSDAAIGLTYTSLFAIGVLLISRFAGQVDLDQDCVLYGEPTFIPLDLWITADGLNLGPGAVWNLGLTLVGVLVYLFLFFPELKWTTFDPVFSQTAGLSVQNWRYSLMAAVSVAAVSAFEALGATLVVAFLIIPPAAAALLTQRLGVMLAISASIGAASAFFGYGLAAALDGPVAGAMTVCAGVCFALALFFAPHTGLLWRLKGLSQNLTGL